MELIRATEQELDELLAFYQHVADNMGKSGLQQWRWGVYPSEEIIREDVLRGDLYYMRSDGALVAAVVFMNGQEPNERGINEFLDQALAALQGDSLMVRKAAMNTMMRFSELGLVYTRLAKSALKQVNLDFL